MLLNGQVAIVTGGGWGIGEAIARRFAAEGAAVLVTARTTQEVENVARGIQDAGGKAAAVVADVSHERDCEKIVLAAIKAFGGIHILVNNAGTYGPVLPVEKISAREWDGVLAVNLKGPFLLSRLVLPGMYERGSGAILNVVNGDGVAEGATPLSNCSYSAVSDRGRRNDFLLISSRPA